MRLYDRLFTASDPEAEAAALGGEGSFRDFLNPESLRVVKGGFVEPSVAQDEPDTRYQFERLGYFWRDPGHESGNTFVFNRIVTLRDSWTRASEREGATALATEERRATRKEGRRAARDESPKGAASPSDPESAERTRELVAHFGISEIDAPYYPHDVPLEGSRKLPFSGELYIDRQDFEEIPPPGFHRLAPGGEVRLRYGCVIRCQEVVKGPAACGSTRRRSRRCFGSC
jgi:glutamyl/glutaminyl-tRNA synthetase